jgi:hypothetical protein
MVLVVVSTSSFTIFFINAVFFCVVAEVLMKEFTGIG